VDAGKNATAVAPTDEFQPIAVDLFSGCGGLTQGLKDAGFRVIGAVEIDTLAADTYASNHPEVKIWREDIRHLSPRLVKRVLRLQSGQLDLLAGSHALRNEHHGAGTDGRPR
jgi:site-specific DNA-cytosine methylase